MLTILIFSNLININKLKQTCYIVNAINKNDNILLRCVEIFYFPSIRIKGVILNRSMASKVSLLNILIISLYIFIIDF